jgi:hypothetical protein
VSPPKVNNCTIKILNDSEMDEISNSKEQWGRMFNKVKEDMYKLWKNSTTIQINCKVKWGNLQNIKGEFNKDMEILKKMNLKFWIWKAQKFKKITGWKPQCRVEEGENKISGLRW